MAKILRTLPDGSLSSEDLAELAAAVRACKLVVFPTDTIYGLGSTGLVKAAARRIYQAKGREAMKPLSILIKSALEARRWVEWNVAAEVLSRRWWPGPLTLVLQPTPEGRLLASPEFPTLAIRVPAHPAALGLLEAAGVPLASTSANLSGWPVLVSGAAVAAELGGLVDFVVDAGELRGAASTIVDATALPARVLREGKVSRADIEETLKAT